MTVPTSRSRLARAGARPLCSALALTLPALLFGCAPEVVREPPRYPPLPPGPSGSSAQAAFVPAPELVASSFACRAEEPALANALDDDCDGTIDGAPADDALVVAIAYPRAAALTLSLRTDGDETAPVQGEPCAADAPFCTARIRSGSLVRGQHELLVDGSASASAVLVSVQSQGKVAAYLLQLEGNAHPRTLGRLAIP